MAKKLQRKENQREGEAPEHGGVVPSPPAHGAPLGSCTPTRHKCQSLMFFLSLHFLEDKKAQNHSYKYFWSTNKMSCNRSKESEMFTVFPLHPYRARQLSFAVYRAHPSSLPSACWSSALGRWQPSPQRSAGKIDGAPRRTETPSHLSFFALNTLIFNVLPSRAPSSFQHRLLPLC